MVIEPSASKSTLSQLQRSSYVDKVESMDYTNIDQNIGTRDIAKASLNPYSPPLFRSQEYKFLRPLFGHQQK